MKVKTENLSGAALDWAVMKLLEKIVKNPSGFHVTTFGPVLGKGYPYPSWFGRKYSPSTDRDEGLRIIERERLKIRPVRGENEWVATSEFGTCSGRGPTLLIAAMRCYVASGFGAEVEVPDQLLLPKLGE